jgi:type IV pilus assembly protein PilY1
MRTLNRVLLAVTGAIVGFAPAIARAQNDISPHLPNVLLLLDTSGSMDYLIQPNPTDGVSPMLPGDPNAPGSACNIVGGVVGPTPPTVLNRWASVVSVLTGSFQANAFGCETLNRNEAKYVTEFSLPPSVLPYDYNYYLPWHRIYSNGCTLGATTITPPKDWTLWGATPFDLHTPPGQCLNGTAPGSLANCCSSFTGQNNDGLLDVFAGLVRFGMMTFDSMPDPHTGATSGSPSYVDGPGAIAGTWSYFHNWQTVTPPAVPTLMGMNNRPAAGEPAGCATPRYMEVGARNQAAPPWEGPLTPFGNAYSDSNIGVTNAQIQNQILAMRPYGATPIAGMLDDAREFLFYDTTHVPNVTPTQDFGPYEDPFWVGGCRKTYIILLTDGSPNMDLRGISGQCDASGGTCPYDTPENILTAMRVNPPGGNLNQSVTTFVVGLALSTPASLPAGETSCSQLNPAVDCINPSAGLAPCCKLQSLAIAGGGTGQTAFFADNLSQLKTVLSGILSGIVGTTTSRTTPVYATAGAGNAQGPNFSANPALSYHFAASFNVTSSTTETNFANGGGNTGPWSGNLVRERYVCNNGVPTAAAVSQTNGDDYAYNLNTPDAAHPRQFLTVIGANAGTAINSDWTIRPSITTDDGFGVYLPQSPTSGLTPQSTFPSAMAAYPAAFGIAASNDQNCKNAFGLVNQAGTCTQYLMNWEIGLTNSLGPTFTPAVSRDPQSAYCQLSAARSCSKLGAIYHSTPVVVGPPAEFIRDDSYTSYANTTSVATQPFMMYTASTDGQLHAFKVAASTSTDTFTTDQTLNNEVWSFMPPAVLQHIMPNFNSGGANLLDGSPVVADIPGITVVGASPPKFERNTTTQPVWHRVLVAGGGYAGGFYYALDITNPLAPQFLWQISTDVAGHRLFGATTPTPAIAIVPILEGGVRTSVPVAILPGGSSTLLTPCTTPPAHPANSTLTWNDPNNPSNPSGTLFNLSGFTPPPLRCWQSYSPSNPSVIPNNGTFATGNSLTIVRLDTGLVLAHITGAGYYGAIGNGVLGDPGVASAGGPTGNSFTTRPFTAPLTGTPVVYPADTGQVADRMYIGDADGQLWRIDFTSMVPSQWAATSTNPPGINLAWDAYIDSPTSAREVVQLAPVLSRDPIGNTVIAYATGDQSLLTSQSEDNRVWSLTETPLGHNTSQNWYLKFAPGTQRVTGPMALFNEVLYFSTYTPTVVGANVCNNGYPSLWGVDYRRPNGAAQPYSGAPLPEFGTPVALNQAGASGSVIFGVSATETPSCGGSANTSDGYFGSHSAVSNVNPSEYRIMWQTGAGAGLTTGGALRNETGVKGMQNMTVPSPGLSTRIDSWAAVVE